MHLAKIKSYNIKVGTALLPTTSIDILNPILDKIDLILLMTVNPGFSGQKFMRSQLPKIRDIKNMIAKYPNIRLSIDGGVSDKNAKEIKNAGADILVSGSFIFSNSKPYRQIEMLKSI
mgnify:CR=1 FL=1